MLLRRILLITPGVLLFIASCVAYAMFPAPHTAAILLFVGTMGNEFLALWLLIDTPEWFLPRRERHVKQYARTLERIRELESELKLP